ncbi:VWA domain-containing protein [bacterium]|nr:VWA domain-containing protein [bacterium]
MTFRDPLFLLAFLPVVLAAVLVLRLGLRSRPAARYPTLGSFAGLRPSAAVLMRRLLPVARVLALGLLVVAFARPQFVEREEEIRTEGIDIMLALDVSGSMQAEDFKPKNRLHVAKSVVSEFLDLIRNDRVGLVVFSGQAFTQCPLTLDYDVLRSMLARVEIGMIEDGTAIGTAIVNCVNRLRDSEAQSKVVILLTDGENNAGKIDPDTAAKVAEAMGVRVYTIGVGKEGGAPIPVDHPVYGKIYARNPDGSLVLTRIDEESLQRIASMTNAQYFRATDAEALRKIYAQILELERTKFQVKQFEKAHEYFRWAAIPAVLLLLAELGMAHTRLRVLP